MSGWVAGTPLSSGLGKFMELARCSPMSSAPKLPEPEPLLLVWRRPTAAAWGGGGCRCWGSRAAPLVVVARWLCNRLADTSRATICRSSAACERTKQECCSCFIRKHLGGGSCQTWLLLLTSCYCCIDALDRPLLDIIVLIMQNFLDMAKITRLDFMLNIADTRSCANFDRSNCRFLESLDIAKQSQAAILCSRLR